MIYTVTAVVGTGGGNSLQVSLPDELLPAECPQCHRATQPVPMIAYVRSVEPQPEEMQAVFRCPRTSCQRLYIANYVRAYQDPAINRRHPNEALYWDYVNSAPIRHVTRTFEPRLANTSSSFVEIYNQAAHAEAIGLEAICGMGYRKALEFLVKDYAKRQNPACADSIEGDTLAHCITTYCKDPNLKFCAGKAAWLGNDESHYIRRWSAMDVSDLKRLIDLAVHWIASELLTEEYRKAFDSD